MKNIILIGFILALAGIGFYAFQKVKPPEPAATNSSRITPQQAVESVKKLPEVQDYLKGVPSGKVEVDNESEGEYNVHVYEIKNGHTATFNWYLVSIKDGKVKEQFPTTQGIVSGKLCYPSEVVPKGTVEAKRLSDEKVFSLNHGGSSDAAGPNYTFKLDQGDYYLRYKVAEKLIGYSTTVCPTGQEESCGDTKPRILTKVEVKLGETVSGYNLCDYYYKDSNAPKF